MKKKIFWASGYNDFAIHKDESRKNKNIYRHKNYKT